MTKLTNAEKDKLDNTCGNLRITKLGTHVKSLEDFVNEMNLDTRSDTVAEAINELYHMIVDKDCEDVQIPPPGFFTLWGNDEDGKLYVYYNNEDHPPLFRHVETPGEDEGTLYLYIADPEGDNHYEMEIGHYIAVKHLENYYTKSEIDAGYAIKNHAVNAATYGKGTASVFGHLKVANNLTTTSTDAIALAAAQGKVLKDLIDGKADSVHTHNKEDITDFAHTHGYISNEGKVGTSANVPLITGTGGVVQAGTFGTGQNNFARGNHNHSDLASIEYVDQQIAALDEDIEIDFASKANTDHSHGSIDKDGVISGQASKNVVTNANGKITTEDKPTIPSANATASNIKMDGTQSAGSLTTFAKADHVHPTDTSRAASTHAHGSIDIVEASALNNIGSSASDTQHTVNTKINAALGDKVDKVSGKSLVDNSEITKLGHVEDYANKTIIRNSLGSDSTTEALAAAQGQILDNKIAALYNKNRLTDDYYIRLIRTQPDGTLYPADTAETWEGAKLDVETNDKLNVQVVSRYGNSVNNLIVTFGIIGSTVRMTKVTNTDGRLSVSDSITLANNHEALAFAILKGTSSREKAIDIVYINYTN